MVMQRSCSSFLVSVNLASPAFAEAIIPALLTKESVSVDFPWSTWAITDMLRILCFLSMMERIYGKIRKGYEQSTSSKSGQLPVLSKVSFIFYFFVLSSV